MGYNTKVFIIYFLMYLILLFNIQYVDMCLKDDFSHYVAKICPQRIGRHAYKHTQTHTSTEWVCRSGCVPSTLLQLHKKNRCWTLPNTPRVSSYLSGGREWPSQHRDALTKTSVRWHGHTTPSHTHTHTELRLLPDFRSWSVPRSDVLSRNTGWLFGRTHFALYFYRCVLTQLTK